MNHPRAAASFWCAALACAAALYAPRADASCGCLLGRLPTRPTVPRDPGAVTAQKPELIMDNSRVVLLRDGDRTVMTMANDVRETDIEDFALLVPVPVVPRKQDVRVLDGAVFQDLELATRPHFTEVRDEAPCREMEGGFAEVASASPKEAATTMSTRSRSPSDYGVRVEEHLQVGEYDIAILSGSESAGLIEWLRLFKYDVPRAAAEVIESYIKQKMFFFVARVKWQDVKGRQFLRPLQIDVRSPKYVLPIRLGMVNADGPQELLVFALSRLGRVEPVNYRMAKLPSGVELPGAFSAERWDLQREMFLVATAAEQQRAVFLEFSGPALQLDHPGTPELPLEPFGASWSTVSPQTGDIRESTWVTRLHFRYDKETFPEDLVLQATSDRERFSIAHTVRFEATQAECPEADPYLAELQTRRARQSVELVKLTGRNLSEVNDRIAKAGPRGLWPVVLPQPLDEGSQMPVIMPQPAPMQASRWGMGLGIAAIVLVLAGVGFTLRSRTRRGR